jgi:5-formyltetrahydrofolate cyclo-ligase
VSTESAAAVKARLRTRVRAARLARSADDRAIAAELMCQHVLALPELASTSVVAAYAAAGAEPDATPLLEALHARGVQVLLPVQGAAEELDWAAYDGQAALSIGPHGISEPVGPRLGVAAVSTATVVIAPALAVDRDGNRLGQGGGGYDRALLRADPTALTVALVYADEVVDALPTEAHDVRIGAAVTPDGVLRFAPHE